LLWLIGIKQSFLALLELRSGFLKVKTDSYSKVLSEPRLIDFSFKSHFF